MKKNLVLILSLVLFLLIQDSSYAQESDKLRIIYKSPHLKEPDRGLISSNQKYALIAEKRSEGIYFAVYDIERMSLFASGEILLPDKLTYAKIANITDDGRYLSFSEYHCHEIEAFYDIFKKKLTIGEPSDEDLAESLRYCPGWYEYNIDKFYDIYIFEEDKQIEIEINKREPYKLIYKGEDIFNLYDEDAIIRISPDQRFLALSHGELITVWDIQLKEKVWQSPQQADINSDFALLDNGIIVCHKVKEKQIDNNNYYWYNYKTDEIIFTTDYQTILPVSCLDQFGSELNIITELYETKEKEKISLTTIDLSSLRYNKSLVENVSCEKIFEEVLDSLIKSDSVIYADFTERRHASWDNRKLYKKYYDKSGKLKANSPKCQLDYSFFKKTGIENRNFKDSIDFIKSYMIHHGLDNKATYSEIHSAGLFFMDYIRIISFWNGNKKKPVEKNVNMFLTTDTIPVFLTDDNYYYSADKKSKSLTFYKNMKVYTFEQFDLKYNRPDIILDRLGYGDSTLIKAYRRAYLKRLQKMGFEEKDLGDDFHLPESEIQNFEYIPIIDQNTINLDLIFKDSKYKLDRYNIWINDVPIFGVRGKSLREKNINSVKVEEELILNKGKNKIQVSCLNEKGVESYKETVEIIYRTKEETKSDLYVISIGVSDYHNSSYDLEFADKDANDVAELLAKNTDKFENIYITKLLNKEATTENILKLKEQLQKTKVDDQVIVFFAGHGLLDGFDYYLGTTETEADNLSETALAYEDFEALLDGIAARQKLLLLDACHSGELDDDTFIPRKEELFADNKRSVSFIGKTRNALSNKTTLSYNNSFELMKALFADLRRGTGSMVISSAGGGEFAIEGEMMKNGKIVKITNGIFTYSLIEALENKKADINHDNKITISELKAYVFDNVSRLSSGFQNPTSRMENLELDFVVW